MHFGSIFVDYSLNYIVLGITLIGKTKEIYWWHVREVFFLIISAILTSYYTTVLVFMNQQISEINKV